MMKLEIEAERRIPLPGSLYVTQLKAPEVSSCFEELVELVRPAFDRAHGEIDASSAVGLCVKGKAYMFIGQQGNNYPDCVLIAELMQFPLKKVVNVVAWAGHATKYKAYVEFIETWAVANGAIAIRGYGTESTMRHARRWGYEEIYRVYEKDLRSRLQ